MAQSKSKKSFKVFLADREKEINDNSASTIEHAQQRPTITEELDNSKIINEPIKALNEPKNEPIKASNKKPGTRAKHSKTTLLTEPRSKIVNARVSEKEYNKLLEDAIKNNCKSISDYIYSLIKKNL